MKPKVYLETSFISYLAARPSRNVTMLDRQMSSHEWWSSRRHLFDLCASPAVWRECRAGDAAEARKRVKLLSHTFLLPMTSEITTIAKRLIAPGLFPGVAELDALHFAVAAVYRCEFLLTWNFARLNNAVIKRAAERIMEKYGYEAPTVCTPDGLMGLGSGGRAE